MQTYKLGNIITLNYGKGLDKKDRNENGKYPVYGANGILAMSNNYYFDGDSIIVGRKGSAGALTRVSGKFRPTDVTYYVTLNQEGDIDYIYFALQTLGLESLAKGVKPGINRNEIYDLQIPLPPLPTQKAIVAHLDKTFTSLDQAIELTKKNLNHLDELKKSVLNKAFDIKNNDIYIYHL